MKKVKVLVTFELQLETELNDNQIKERIYSVLNEFHADDGETSPYFDQEEIESSKSIASEIQIKR
jgi:hypothetical protein